MADAIAVGGAAALHAPVVVLEETYDHAIIAPVIPPMTLVSDQTEAPTLTYPLLCPRRATLTPIQALALTLILTLTYLTLTLTLSYLLL